MTQEKQQPTVMCECVLCGDRVPDAVPVPSWQNLHPYMIRQKPLPQGFSLCTRHQEMFDSQNIVFIIPGDVSVEPPNAEYTLQYSFVPGVYAMLSREVAAQEQIRFGSLVVVTHQEFNEMLGQIPVDEYQTHH